MSGDLLLKIALAVFFLGALSCNLNDADEIFVGPKGGRCFLKVSGGTSHLCLYFSSGDSNVAYETCQTQATNRSLNSDWLAGDGNSCDATDGIGSCTSGSLLVSYYSAGFNTSTATTDCAVNFSGTFVSP